jgi:hypothetical protein
MKILRRFIYVWIATVLLTPIIAMPLQAQGPLNTLVIHSQYRNPYNQQWNQEIVWNFRPRKTNQYAIFQNDQTQPMMLLSYSLTGHLVGITDLSAGISSHSGIAKEGTITLSWGFPIPFDDLDEGGLEETTATVHKQIGETRFAYQITKETASITQEEAAAEGMLKFRSPSADGPVKSLKLIVVRQNKTILIRQLWETGSHWWLYEETPERRSWLVP